MSLNMYQLVDKIGYYDPYDFNWRRNYKHLYSFDILWDHGIEKMRYIGNKLV